ncbi:EAL domain-containing protein [Cellulomonas sp. HZM]|uniref:EAL domain-containing protein n=1 Tax=Cellulomonas sp. HZM TaxID=1454010 RepID=UPI0004937B76|nr:EAL domain-containing protein [Cellulomonas sp. HZM]
MNPLAPRTRLPGRPPVARQPIWTADGRLYAHELLYRSADGLAVGVDLWDPPDQDLATASVLEALDDEPDERGVLSFVNVTRSYVVGRHRLPRPDDGLVLEIVETVPADDEVLAGLQRLRELGYRIALDDFAAEAHQVAMLPYAHYVKIDCRELVQHGTALVELARRDGAMLVAERLSSSALVDRCVSLGFDLLQGDALGPATTARS